MLTTTIRNSAMAVAALSAFGLGGATLAGAADDNGSPTPRPPAHQRQSLSAETAAKVKATALEKVPGATVLRTEAGGPYGSAYHAHIKTSDGTHKVVLVNASFEATAVQSGPGRRPGGGRHGHGGRHDHGGRGHSPEAPLTGETKTKVEAAVLGKYPGATIVRSETNGDSSAPYEAHITTSGGTELEVLVDKGFKVVDSREHPVRAQP